MSEITAISDGLFSLIIVVGKDGEVLTNQKPEERACQPIRGQHRGPDSMGGSERISRQLEADME